VETADDRSRAPDTGAPDTDAPDTDPHRLYDAGRGLFYGKPRLRGWAHLVWFEASLVLGTLVIVAAHGAREVTAASIYAASVSAMFGVSALYHRGNWTARASRVLQRADHAMIFLMIAGSATPAFLLAAPGPYGTVCLGVLWLLAGIAAGIHLAWMSAPEALVGATFIGLGCTGGLALRPIWIHDGVAPALLILIGGVLYIIGAILYHRRSPDPFPAVFGYHEVFHTYVCAAAACQYVAIAVFIL
jgi:hemolysin III